MATKTQTKPETKLVPTQVVRFTKLDPAHGIFPNEFSMLRIEANERLTKARAEQLAQLVGYCWTSYVRGEALGEFRTHGHNAIVFHMADFTKSRRSDPELGMVEFLAALSFMIREGSPVRLTDRSGPGTRGTRLVEGMGHGTKVSVWVDEVVTL